MRYLVLLSLTGMTLMMARQSIADTMVLPPPTIERLGEFDAVLYGTVSAKRMVTVPGLGGVTYYQSVVDITIEEIFWDRNNRLASEQSITVGFGMPTRVEGAARSTLTGQVVGEHRIWCLDERKDGIAQYRLVDDVLIEEPGRAGEVLEEWRKTGEMLRPFRQARLHLHAAPGIAIAEVPMQLALWHHGADATVVPEDLPALRNFRVEATWPYWALVTSVRSSATTDNAAGGVLWISVLLVPRTQPLHVTEPLEIPPVQRCEVRVLMRPPGSRARLASPWVTVTVVRPDLGDLDRRLIEEISRRRLWGVVGPHEETLSDEQTEALAEFLARHPESLLAPAIRCGLAFGTTGRLVERAVELKALSADASFGWREECLLKAYALFREAGQDAEAERVAAQLSAPWRIGSRLIDAPATRGGHVPEATPDVPKTEEQQ